MTKRLVLFDIDGTILLSGGAGRRAILRALAEEVPVGPSIETVRFDGKTDPQIVVELLDAAGVSGPHGPERVATMLDRYLVHLERELGAGVGQAVVMPGVVRLLEDLAQDDRMVVGLLTGNITRGASLKLTAAAIGLHHFRLGAYGSDHHDRSELPAIAVERSAPWFAQPPRGTEIVIIGDTPADVTCGRGVGARSIAVATGCYGIDELREAGAHHAFLDLADTAAVRAAILA